MKLKAHVRGHSGRTVHSVGTIADGKQIPLGNMQPAVCVELDQVDEHFFLYRFDQAGESVGDTRHETLNEAKAQAKFEFGIQESDWKVGVRIWDHDAIARGPELKGAIREVP